MKLNWAAPFIIMSFLTVATAAQQAPSFWNAANLIESKECLLQIVRSKMLAPNHLTSPSLAPSPQVKLESEITLKEFQDAMEIWWKFRPDVFTNVYFAAENTVFLSNNVNYYNSPRTPFDSLVHELAHFVQAQDLGGASFDEDALESEAVGIQTWFRENRGQYIQNQKYSGPCQ